MQKRSLKQNAVLNTIKTVVGIIFPIITFPYVSRVLGVEMLGVYNLSASIVSYFTLIAALGISTYGIREGSQYRDNEQKIKKFVSEIFSINMLSTFVSYVLLILSLLIIPHLQSYSIAILILSSEIVCTTLGTAWVCNIYEDYLFIAVRTLVIQVISLILTLTLVKSPRDLYKYIGIIAFANSGSNLLNLFYIRRKYCKFRLTLDIDWKRHLRPILIIFSTSVAITVYVSSDTTMLGFMTSDYDVGLYSTAVKIYSILKNVLAALLMVLIPRFSRMFVKREMEKSIVLFSKVFNILTLLMLPMTVGLFILSKDVVVLISDKTFIGAAEPLRILSIAVLFSLYAYMYTQCILIPIKKEGIVFKATVISAVVNLGLNFILIPFWGINAAAFTTMTAEAITFAISYKEARKYISLIDVKKNFISVLIGCVGIILVCLPIQTVGNYAVRISGSILVSIVVYFAVLMLMKNSTLKELSAHIFKKLI